MRAATLGLALLAAGAGAQLDHYRGGGQSRSPDGRWRIWSRAPDADVAESTTASLSGPGVQRRLLLRYEPADVLWMADGRHVVLKTQTAHFATINVFRLGSTDAYPPGRAEGDMEARMAASGPKMERVENRSIALGAAFRRSPCVLVLEAGLPPGREQGSYLSRSAAFRLDLASGHALPVADCPGAKAD